MPPPFACLVAFFVIKFVKFFYFVGVERNALKQSRTLVCAGAFFVYVFNHFILFTFAHTKSMLKKFLNIPENAAYYGVNFNSAIALCTSGVV